MCTKPNEKQKAVSGHLQHVCAVPTVAVRLRNAFVKVISLQFAATVIPACMACRVLTPSDVPSNHLSKSTKSVSTLLTRNGYEG